ncbi:MAG TPA: SDR family oxidoreductase [Longimicrobiaceae bacterium]|nr:SDR family oxidoreductase [Longimicrobiaceae bacterium]
MANGGEAKGAALITGASGGIGAELAKLFAADGHDLVLVARDTARLEAVGAALAAAHGVRHHVVPADLADPAAPDAVLARVRELGVAVEALVNNAGFGLYGTFVRTGPEPATDLRRELDLLQVNVAALTHLAKLFLPEMVARRRGRLLNVASTAAFQPGPLMAVYYASKAYVLSFSEALAVELDGTGVTVTTLCPGPTRTDFQAAASLEGTRLFRAPNVMSAGAVARAGYRGMRAGKRVVIPGTVNKVMAHATKLVPRALAARVAKAAQEKA